MEAGELKAFLTDSVGQPPTGFEPDLDDRNRYLDWCNLKIREKYAVRKIKVTVLDPGVRDNTLAIGTIVTSLSFDAFEVTFSILHNEAWDTLFISSQVHDGPMSYLDQWDLTYTEDTYTFTL